MLSTRITMFPTVGRFSSGTKAGTSIASASISASLISCLKSFQGLVARTKDPLSLQSGPDQPSLWEDELGRLRIWAANIGAHQSGQASLDHRLRDASHISLQVKKLLRDLRQTIRDVEEVLREQESPPGSPRLDTETAKRKMSQAQSLSSSTVTL